MLLSELRAQLRHRQDTLGDVEVLVEVGNGSQIFGVDDVDVDRLETDGPHCVVIVTDETER